MNPPDQPTQPSETHKQLAADVFRMVHNRDLTAAAQLIADSEARALTLEREKLQVLRDAYIDLHNQRDDERERVRVLESVMAEMSEAITAMTGNSDEPSPFMSQAGLRAFRANKKAKALAKTEKSP
jgi:hypothetical protein